MRYYPEQIPESRGYATGLSHPPHGYVVFGRCLRQHTGFSRNAKLQKRHHKYSYVRPHTLPAKTISRALGAAVIYVFIPIDILLLVLNLYILISGHQYILAHFQKSTKLSET